MSDNATPNEQPEAVKYEAWEQNPDWPHVVAEEINRSGMLPRDAKRLLAAAGEKVQKGLSIDEQIKAIKGLKQPAKE